MKGYIIRALKELNASEEERQKLFRGLSWAISELTMEDARHEYEKYCRGQIEFNKRDF